MLLASNRRAFIADGEDSCSRWLVEGFPHRSVIGCLKACSLSLAQCTPLYPVKILNGFCRRYETQNYTACSKPGDHRILSKPETLWPKKWEISNPNYSLNVSTFFRKFRFVVERTTFTDYSWIFFFYLYCDYFSFIHYFKGGHKRFNLSLTLNISQKLSWSKNMINC